MPSDAYIPKYVDDNTGKVLEYLGEPVGIEGVKVPKVLNRKTSGIPPGAVYVGRPSKWGNLYSIGKGMTRERSIALYANWLDGMIFNGILNLDELQGKDLVCWCAPLPCHADVLLELANA